MWHLIYNKLNILIDPIIFAPPSTIEKQVSIVTMLKDYLPKTDPVLCDVIFHYPVHIQETLNIRNVFHSFDKEINNVSSPKKVVNVFDDIQEIKAENKDHYNELFSIAIENKIPFVLSDISLEYKSKKIIKDKYNINVIDLDEVTKIISAFLQGFYNYYKFDKPLYGVDNPDIAHAMSDMLHQKMNIFHSKISQNEHYTDAIKERVRSLVHNRYVDILVTIDRINFYKIQQYIFDIENNIIENREPKFAGQVRYFLNYYYLLVFGFTDHLAIIINDIFQFGYDTNKIDDQKQIGFKKSKKGFLDKIKTINIPLYDYIISEDFQEWFYILGKIRHQVAHREMLSPVPLLGQTEGSQLSDDAIDEILYKDKKPIDDETYKAITNTIGEEYAKQTNDYQKSLDRAHYRISKTDKLLDYFISYKKEDGTLCIFDPVARLHIDYEKLDKLINMFLDAYNSKK